MIIPEIAAGAAGELDDLRAACDAAVDRLLASGADAVVVLGAGDRTRWLPNEAYGSFAPFGVSIEVALQPGAAPDAEPTGVRAVPSTGVRAVPSTGLMARPQQGRAVSLRAPQDPPSRPRPGLPLSVAVGAWLLARRRHTLTVSAVAVDADADAAHCAGLAAQLAARPEPVALLVMGDGSACRGEKSPGYDDPRAQPYDDAVAQALATADVSVLRGLDRQLSAELLVAGRAPWQVLAGVAGDSPWRGHLSYYAAPYGVAYFVADWEPR